MKDDAFENNIKYLEILLKEITKRNITPVFITSPVHKTYYDNTDSGKILLIEEVINNLCLKYSCRYYNYFRDSRFEDEDFADVDHLNPKGAEKYSEIIDDEILSK